MNNSCKCLFYPALLAALCGTAASVRAESIEGRFLSPPVRVTEGMPKAGEGYFAADGRTICYQAVPDGYPFYQIFVQAFDAAAPRPCVTATSPDPSAFITWIWRRSFSTRSVR